MLRNRFITQKINDPNQPPKATCLRNSLKKLKNFRILCEHCLCEQNHDLTLVRGGGWRESGKRARSLLTTLNLFHSHFSQEILFPCWQRWCFLYCQMQINDKWPNFCKTEVRNPWAADQYVCTACQEPGHTVGGEQRASKASSAVPHRLHDCLNHPPRPPPHLSATGL